MGRTNKKKTDKKRVDKKKIPCYHPDCVKKDTQFTSRSTLKRHLGKFHTPDIVLCQYCDHGSESAAVIEQHQEEEHADDAPLDRPMSVLAAEKDAQAATTVSDLLESYFGRFLRENRDVTKTAYSNMPTKPKQKKKKNSERAEKPNALNEGETEEPPKKKNGGEPKVQTTLGKSGELKVQTTLGKRTREDQPEEATQSKRSTPDPSSPTSTGAVEKPESGGREGPRLKRRCL